jgi:predicted component of type VI protein secretion system
MSDKFDFSGNVVEVKDLIVEALDDSDFTATSKKLTDLLEEIAAAIADHEARITAVEV